MKLIIYILRQTAAEGNGLADPNVIPPDDLPAWMAGTHSGPELDAELLEDMADYFAQIRFSVVEGAAP